MTSDKVQALSNMSTRQKVTAGVIVLVVLIIIWQVSSLFGGGSSPTIEKTPATNQNMAAAKVGGAGGGGQPQMMTPKPAELPQTPSMSDREAALMKLQQDTQAKYLEAINELQILKINRDIANTNKDISAANLSKVTADKKIIDMLAPPPPPPTSEAINKSAISQVTSLDENALYTVVSVSQLQYRWGAVLGYKGNLFNVRVGDTLPPDGSTVVAIGKSGVTLEKEGVKKKVSLVPII